MSCRCGERRALLGGLGRAVLRADANTAARSAQAIGRTLNADAQDLAVRLARLARTRPRT